MSPIGFLLERFRQQADRSAFIWRDETYSYGWLLDEIERSRSTLLREVRPGAVTSLESDFSPRGVALLLELIDRGCIVVPLTRSVEAQKPRFREIAEVEFLVAAEEEPVRLEPMGVRAEHPLIEALRERGHPGIVFFTSGTTGEPKAALQDLVPILERFRTPRQSKRTITFLLFDHIGGMNTLFFVLSNCGCAIVLEDRSPEEVCEAIERHRAQILPTSPTFLNLLLASGALRGRDLSSLELITYGTEVMPETTLERLHAELPNLHLLQTYGLTETGILRTSSRSSDSLWVKLGGEGFETRIVDGMLEIRTQSAMLGYLNAPSPLTADGWLKTGDEVEVDGEYVRILGRRSDIINVGGEKVFPAEIESVLHSMSGVEDVAVDGQANPIMGQIVTARVRLSTGETLSEFRKRMHAFCRERLPRFKIPQKITLVDEPLHGGRFKKVRRAPQTVSTTTVAPCPPPMHAEAKPRPPPRRRSS